MHVDRGYLDTGRDSVLDALDAGTLLVIGPAGSGRTMLLEDLAAVEARRRRRVWWCRGHVQGEAGGEVLLRDEVPVLLAEVATAPTTVLVDDAHLLDDGTIERLVAVAARHRDLGVRIVASRRPVRVGAALAALDAALIGPGGTGVAHLQPLTVEAVADWLRSAAQGPLGADLPRRAADLWGRTGGWPELVAIDLAGHGRTDGPLRELVRARVAVLDERSQRIIRAVAFGLPADSPALLEATGGTTADIDRALEAAEYVGLLHGGPAPVDCVAAALRTETPRSERDQIALAAASCGGAGAVIAVASHLAEVDARSPAAARAYARAGGELRVGEPERALALFDLAVEAGEPVRNVLPSLVACAAASGRPTRAIELAAIASADSAPLPADDRAAIQRAAGVAWAQLGRPDLAAGCLVQAGQTNLAVLALVAAGDARRASELILGPPSPTDPTTLAAEGALAWVRGDASAAGEALDRGAVITEVTGGVQSWPDSAHALGALVALLALDGRGARRLAGAAVTTQVGGAAFRDRHQLLLGWAALRAGQADEAHAALQAVETLPLVPRDRLLAVGLRAALTLRFGDPAELIDLHQASAEALVQTSLELYALDVAAELACLAARVGASPDSLLGPAERAAEAMGRPITLTVPLAWARLVVALTVDDAAAARAAATDLADLSADADTGTFAAELAQAATTVADVLDGEVDPIEVRAVAALLTGKGRVFEATRLVGAAALRTTDTGLARSLLGDLRRLKSTQIRPAGGRDRAVAALSEREREVARLVLDGRTHREIGTELYISAKTVEHHVAKVRQKLGATTRSELLAAIRDELART